MSVPRDHLSWRRCDFAGRVNLLDSERAASALCISVRMSVRGFLLCFDLAPACLCGDLSGSEIPRFFGSGASPQRSF